MSIRDEIDSISVGFLRRFYGSRLMYSLAIQFDALIDWAVLAIKAKYPSKANPDALALIGNDRQIIRGYAETDDSFRARCVRWIDDRRLIGGAVALAGQLRGYCGDLVQVRVVNNAGAWHSIGVDGSYSYQAPNGNWNWDGNSAKWWRYWVILYINPIWQTAPTYGTGAGKLHYGTESAWGVSASPAQCNDLTRIIRAWYAAHARCSGVILAFDPASFDPTAATVTDGDWGTWHKISGGVAVPSRLATARYYEVDP